VRSSAADLDFKSESFISRIRAFDNNKWRGRGEEGEFPDAGKSNAAIVKRRSAFR
jgi:hypothetical protein